MVNFFRIWLGLGIIYGLYLLVKRDGKSELNININTRNKPQHTYIKSYNFSYYEKTYYQRRREAYQRMHREKIFVSFDEIDDFHKRWKKKWVEEEGRSPNSYNRYYKLEDIY